MFGTVLTIVFANLLLLMLSQGRASVDYMQYSFVKGGNKVETPNIQGCTSDFLLPDKPFLVIWNYPSASCEAQGIDLNLAAWDIIDNKNDVFAGDNMTIFYELGHWPTYNQKRGDIYNGGVPQQGDLVFHMTGVKTQVLDLKPDFSGAAVIDFESWRPLYVHNFDSLSGYQQLSLDIVKARYPYLNKSATAEEALREFDIGARIFFEGTIDLARQLRPEGYWGYYGFPRNWGGPGGQAQNDELSYIWNKSTGLYPSIYMSDLSDFNQTGERIWGTVNETLRVWAKYSPPGTLILPYTLCQNNGTNFFSKENLTLAIGLPGEMGAAGVVIWGSSSLFYTKNECKLLQNYISTILGPYVKNITDFFTVCSTDLCSGHGRCARKDLEKIVHSQRVKSGQEYCLMKEELLDLEPAADSDGERSQRETSEFSGQSYGDYVCRCLKGWTGEHCSQRF